MTTTNQCEYCKEENSECMQYRFDDARLDMTTTHTWFACPPGCEKDYCQFCIGGLGLCTVCDGFEGELPTECPGHKMTPIQKAQVYEYGWDFKNGTWHTSGGPMDHAYAKEER